MTVIYTPWSNLHKDGSMAVGQVGFTDQKKARPTTTASEIMRIYHIYHPSDSDTKQQVKRVLVKQRENPIVNRLNKTKVEDYPDLRMEKENRLRELRKRDQAARLERVSHLEFPHRDLMPGLSKHADRELLRELEK